MDKRSEGRSRAQSKSPGRAKKPGRPKSKSPGRPKSPKRPKSPGRPKSPSRSKKSPSRSAKKSSPGRKASPARKISPVRKTSPVRRFSPAVKDEIVNRALRSSPFIKLRREDDENMTSKSVESFKTQGQKSEVEVLFIDDNLRYKTSLLSVKYDGNLSVGDVRQVKWEDGNYYEARILNLMDVSSERSGSIPKASSSTTTEVFSSESTLIRRSTRLKQNEELDKIKNVVNAEVDKILKANNVPLPPQYERKFGEKPVREFGNWPGALVAILLLPAITLLLHVSCSKNKCSGLGIPSLNWKVYLDLHIAGYYLGFIALQALLSSLPVGRKASYGQLHVRLSGFYYALFTLSALGGLYYYGINVTAVLGKSVALLTSSVLFNLLLALALFIKGGRATTSRNLNADGNKLYDFYIGRELFPTVGPLNIKAFLARMEFIGILLLNSLYVLKFMETHAAGVYSPTLLFVVATQSVYVLDALWFEEKFMTSFDAQYEGVGYMKTMAAATWPFLFTLGTRFVFLTGYEAPKYLLAICGIFFLLGYFLYRASNSQKAEFRKNPQHPVFAKYETISTFHGKRLLVGGLWGWVRHPNYAGDLVVIWSIAAVFGATHWLPYAFPAIHAAVLVHRTFRVNTRCKTLYGAAWDRYTQLVKHRLVPRIF